MRAKFGGDPTAGSKNLPFKFNNSSGFVVRRKLSCFWHTVNQRRSVRAGEVCDPGESEWEAKKTKDVIQ